MKNQTVNTLLKFYQQNPEYDPAGDITKESIKILITEFTFGELKKRCEDYYRDQANMEGQKFSGFKSNLEFYNDLLEQAVCEELDNGMLLVDPAGERQLITNWKSIRL